MSTRTITLDSHFDAKGHPDPWRNQVAGQLNTVLMRCRRVAAQRLAEATDRVFLEVALCLVQRVAEFEEIQMEPRP